jgi:hypothetical protein
VNGVGALLATGVALLLPFDASHVGNEQALSFALIVRSHVALQKVPRDSGA